MAIVPDPREAADSESPGGGRFRPDDGRATHRYYVDGDLVTLTEQVRTILGYNAEGTDGRIARTPPRCHPKYTDLFASDVSEVGYGVPFGEATPPAFGATTITPTAVSYPDATVTVEFTKRPYDVLDDDGVIVLSGLWHDEAGEERQFKYAAEWLRYCKLEETFDPKIITAQQGSLMFARQDRTQRPHREPFPASPRLSLPEFFIKCTWYQVPWRYVWSRRSYLKSLAHKVNQLPWDFREYHFEPGELLYEGYTYKPYNPPFPRNDVAQQAARTPEKWVDVELTFSVAYRAATDPPELNNKNWIAHGHNVLPSFVDRQFHYVCSFRTRRVDADPLVGPIDPQGDANYWHPLFYSAPLQLLFMDPDVAQPDPTIILGKP